jgi:hypothetical protein
MCSCTALTIVIAPTGEKLAWSDTIPWAKQARRRMRRCPARRQYRPALDAAESTTRPTRRLRNIGRRILTVAGGHDNADTRRILCDAAGLPYGQLQAYAAINGHRLQRSTTQRWIRKRSAPKEVRPTERLHHIELGRGAPVPRAHRPRIHRRNSQHLGPLAKGPRHDIEPIVAEKCVAQRRLGGRA